MKQEQEITVSAHTLKQQVQQLFYTSREDTAAETIMKMAMGPLALWACLYSLLPWLLG
jgi:hypothetical protein